MTVLELAASFILIVLGAIGFTNAVEWLGHRLNLGEGAVGALLAAVGTALPESTIPIVALINGGEQAEPIAIGAIIGAPLLLGTLAMLLVVISAKAFRSRREQGDEVEADVRTARRDLRFFLGLFALGIAVGAIGAPLGVRIATAVVLVCGYIVYATRTVRRSGDAAAEEELKPLLFDPTKDDPPSLLAIVTQFLVSLGAIIVGAELFVHVVEAIAEDFGLSTLVLALVLAPIATELPEKVNSVVWMRDGKDELAVGNVTGAMTFQATIPVVFGLVLTSWDLDRFALAAACAALAGGALALWAVGRGRFGLAPGLAWGALFGGFVVYAMTG